MAPTDGAAYQALNTYLQRDLAGLKSRPTLGETHTTGELFDGLLYRGVQLASDDRMLPQSLRGYLSHQPCRHRGALPGCR
ncbi:fimbria/pilus outer membrane usher protein [Pseudomonas sp. D47]|uniref:fimbria/pilus outer membrane usher protein n=1 Tax=Pseudomonas sp. D47 TaxID=3159447 RepID=UPI00387B29E4